MSLRGGGLCEDVSSLHNLCPESKRNSPTDQCGPPLTVLLLLRRMLCPRDHLLLSRRRGGR